MIGSSPHEDIFSLFPQKPSKREKNLYPFRVRVGLMKRRPPRHPYFDFTREMGAAFLADLFDGTRELEGDLMFVFPERHLNVLEQQNFTHELAKHNKIKSVDIITSSPMIIGSFYKEQIRICTFDDDHKD